jgi:hypothetical protein
VVLKQEKLLRAALIASICGGYLDLVELLISKLVDVGFLLTEKVRYGE